MNTQVIIGHFSFQACPSSFAAMKDQMY